MSLTTITSLEGRGEEDESGRQRRTGRDGHDRDESELIEAIAEERDQLAGPQRRERAVEREPDIRMLPDSLDGLDRRLGDRDRDGPPGCGRGSRRGVGGGRGDGHRLRDAVVGLERFE
jgi:hypothetical protein